MTPTICIALLLASLLALIYVGYRVGVSHGRFIERKERLRHLQEKYDEMSETPTLDAPTRPRSWADYRYRWN